MAEEDQEEVVEGKGGSKKLIIMVVGGVLALLIIVGATLFFTGFFGANEPATSDDPATEQTEGAESDEDGEKNSDEAAEEGAETAYLALSPAFMVNFQGKGIKVMKVSVSVMAHSEETLEAIKLHDPVIRNNILLLLSAENPNELKTSDGKQKLQGAILEEINKVLKERKVKALPEAVFFTDLVMQ